MPPSGRKGKTRMKRVPAADAHEASDAETPEAITTPSRSSRKRQRISDVVESSASRPTRRKIKDTRTAEREGTEGTEPQEPSDDETEPGAPSEADIISHLRVADRHVNATEDFSNDLLAGQDHIPGYGKIAGRDWTFIIRKVEVNIGRPEAQERLAADDHGHPGPSSSRTVVDIDLGPDRQVSRSHAVISYDSDSMAWYIVVNGRNGLRVDTLLLKRGIKSVLRNGSVIDVAGTQMAFITTASPDGDGPIWDASIIKQTTKSSEEEDGDEDPRNGTSLYAIPAVRSTLQNSSTYGNDVAGGAPPTQQRSSQQPRGTQRAAGQTTPGTPMRSQQSITKSSPAANYARGVMMESTESIDYSADGAKDLKPPHSYAQLIGMAILSTSEQQMTLSNIYKFIMDHYAFYRFNTSGWQNSIRHNLSLNKAFTKIARRTDEPGKGMKWMIEPSQFDNFVQQGMKGCRRPNPVPGVQSSFGSPNSPMNPPRGAANSLKREEEVTPPERAYRPLGQTAVEAYTPERGPKRQVDANSGLPINGDGPQYDYPSRVTPRHGITALTALAGSPPSLYVSDDTRVGPLDTPFPLRPSQRLAPPSTLKRPSDFIQFSSPAPFWKMEGLTGSTPFKTYDLSPLKTPFPDWKRSTSEIKTQEGVAEDVIKPDASKTEADEDKKQLSPVIASSSPPRPSSSRDGPDASPTHSRPATAVVKNGAHIPAANEAPASDGARGSARSPVSSLPPLSAPSAPPPFPQEAALSRSVGNGQVPTAPPPAAYAPVAPMGGHAHANGAANGFPDDGDDEGIDLAKGFQPIGTFHQRNHLAMMAPTAQAGAFGR